MLVNEIMSKNVVSIDCNKTVIDACKVYSKHKVGSLVVMDKNIIVGIITERDTIERVILQNKDPKKTMVREIMSPNIITVNALAPLDRASQIMKESDIKKITSYSKQRNSRYYNRNRFITYDRCFFWSN